MGMPAKVVRRRWTASEVRRLTADAPNWWPRYELIDGDLVVTPSPGPPHQRAVTLLLVALATYCDAHAVGIAMPSPADIELEPESVRQPDVFVLPTAEWKRIAREGFPARELLLAVEVLSPSTADVDRVAKRALYQQRVSEYWVVDVDARVLERWRPGDIHPEFATRQITWHPAGAPMPLVVDAVALFAQARAEN
jgi:Uma2 family endonuclease